MRGIRFKVLVIEFTRSMDNSAATHNRIDALAWGVFLNLLLTYKGEKIKVMQNKVWFTIVGLLLFIGLITIQGITDNIIFNKVVLHSAVPFSFFLMILGVYYNNFKKLMVVRFLAYYSYNWYLWHPIFVWLILDKLGSNYLGLAAYLFITFTMAILTTILIEETMLKIRPKVINKLFK